MKKTISICLLTGAIALAGSKLAFAQTIKSPSISAVSLSDSLSRAGQEKKLVALEFFSYNSLDSKMMDDWVLASPSVKVLINESYVLAKMDVDADPVLKTQFALTQIPTIIILRPDGSEVDRIAGLVKAPEFVHDLRAAVGGQSELSQLTEKAKLPAATIQDHLALAGGFVKRGKYTDAIAEYNHCLDRISESPAGPDARFITVVLERMTALKGSTPTVVDTLKERRDQLEKQVAVKPADSIRILFAINEALKEPARNATAFLLLPAGDPLRERLLPSVLPSLVESRHYAEAVTSADLENVVNALYTKAIPLSHEEVAEPVDPAHAHAHTHEPHQDPVTLKHSIVVYTVAAVEALLATDHVEPAKRLAGRAMDFVADGTVRDQIAKASAKADSSKSAEFKKWLDQYPVPAPKSVAERAPEPAAGKPAIQSASFK